MRRSLVTKTLLGLVALLLLNRAATGQRAFEDRAKVAQATGPAKDQVIAAVWQYHKNGPPIKTAIDEILVAERELGHSVTDELWTADVSPNAMRGYNSQPWSEWYVVYSYLKDGEGQVAQWIVHPSLRLDSSKPDADRFEYSLTVQRSPLGGAVERVATRIAEQGNDWTAKSLEASATELGDLRNAATTRTRAVDRALMEAAMNQVMERWGAKHYFDSTLPAKLRGKPTNDFSREAQIQVAYQVPNHYSSGSSVMAPATPVDGKPGYWLVTPSWTVAGRRSEATWISNPENGIVDPANREAQQIDATLRAAKDGQYGQ